MKKMKQIMKDEEGLTLVELLAVVVIMAIIAGIAAVSISKVIQRTREDAQVSNVQQMFASANLYDIQEENGIGFNNKGELGETTLEDLKKAGSIKTVEFLADKTKASDIKFEKNENGVIYLDELPAGSLVAGKKSSKAFKGYGELDKSSITEENVQSLTRDILFGEEKGNESK